MLNHAKKLSASLVYILAAVTLASTPSFTQAREYEFVSAGEFYAEGQTLKNVVSYEQAGNQLRVQLTDNKVVQLQFITPSILRVRFNKDGMYDVDHSYAVIHSDFGNVAFSVAEDEAKLTLTSAELKIEINKAPYGLSIYKDNILVNADTTKAISWNSDGIVTHKKILPGAKFYGFGEKTGPLLKNGTNMTMWNSDSYKYNETTDPVYQSIPFFIETNDDYTYGILFDNTYQTYFNMGRQKSDEYYFGAQDGEINYYFISGKDVKNVISKYTDLTGRINMPPKWALGYQQSKYSYFPDTKVKQIAKTLREKKLPTDVIYLDIDYMDAKKSFTWSKTDFPNFPGMIDGLHKQGFKVISIIDPGMKAEKGYYPYDSGVSGNHFIKNPKGELAIGPVWPGDCVFPDFTKPETRDWWGTLYKPLTTAGIDGFWNDMNEPSVFSPSKTLPQDVLHYDFGLNSPHAKIHNVYGMEMIRATFEGLQKLRPQNRNFVLSRAGYAGLQRYGAMWTGDNTSNWEHYKLNIPMVLNLGISGIPLTGADIGGFAGSPSPELFARWMELGAFTPVYRNHTEKGTADQEPWSFGPEVEKISREYLELRYKLMQYLYDCTYTAHKTGIPIDRPLFMEFPSDKSTYIIEDEFMFGSGLLIAPVTKEGAVSREVYLPSGSDWYDYWSGAKYIGGNRYCVDAPLSKLPIFVKAGAIIPTREIVQYTGEKEINPITFLVYPGQEAQYSLYEDDESTLAYQQGAYRETVLSASRTDTETTIKIKTVKNSYTPKEKYLYIKLIDNMAKDVKINGAAVQAANKNEWKDAAHNCYYYNAKEKSTIVKIVASGDNTELKVQ